MAFCIRTPTPAIPWPVGRLAVLDLFAQRDVLSDNRVSAQRLTELAEPLTRHGAIRAHRQMGMIWAWDVDTQDPTFSARYHRVAMEEVCSDPLATRCTSCRLMC